MSTAQFQREEFKALARAMTPEELGDFLSGHGMWKTQANPRLGIPAIVMTDGTYGVRYSIQQIEQDEQGGQDVAAFLGGGQSTGQRYRSGLGYDETCHVFPERFQFRL
ncbi:hypothetical protein ABK905_13580 [Acerihabitans sp. KWT182]|uniref:Uncharacterized protein n=1 Tax=Acerihabitans sp. KWT182 TaxID=3157919 RepID=A0AAU7Q467_9GAMM